MTAATPAVNYNLVWLYLDDDGWGADFVRFSNDGGDTWSDGRSLGIDPMWLTWNLFSYTDDIALRIDGQHAVTAQFSDDGGATWGPTASASTLVDEQGPVVVAPDGYWNTRHLYTLKAHDQVGLSGVRRLWYRVDAGTPALVTNTSPLGTSHPLTASFVLAGKSGTPHTIAYVAQDYAGNYSGLRAALDSARAARGTAILNTTYSAYVVVDRTRPTVSARGWDNDWHRGPVAVSFSATDGLAGVAQIQCSVTRANAKHPGAWTNTDMTIVSRSGRSKVWYRAIDLAQPHGNVSVARYVIVKIRP